MRRQFLLPSVSWLIILATAATVTDAQAQRGPDIFVTPIPGSPFSAVVNVQRSVVQPDGSVLNLKSIRNIARDSQGRIYAEGRDLVPSASASTPKILRIHLYDPQTRISAMLYPPEKTYSTITVNRPPATEPPALLYASPAGTALPQNDFAKEEDLGTREIEGLQAHGVRETQSIPPADASGKDAVVTDEYWYSAELRINLLIKHGDPRTGTVTLSVAQVVRTEPDPALFQIPSGYKPAGAEDEKGK
jgi:hypothetical protein